MDQRDSIVRLDLTNESVTSEPVPEGWLRAYVGGKGLGARYLYEEVSPGTDPLGDANALCFLVGPLTGYLPGEQRYVVVTKSPLTGTFLDSYAGGSMAARLAGSLGRHVGVLVTGRAERPVALSIADGTVTIESADEWWGLDARETDDRVQDASVACIGPAGENLVSYATIASDGGEHHAGRGGAGAVMGAKRLKAVVAHDEPPTADDELRALRRRDVAAFADDETGRWHAASETVETIDFANEVGVLPTHGWQEGTFEGTDDIGIEAVRAAASDRERPNSPVPGGFRVESSVGDGDSDGTTESVPRGATPISLGAGLGIDEFDAVATLGSLCDRLGQDVISSGNAVAWAIRASEEGHLDRDLSFGDDDAARELIEEIAARSSSLGDALADGVEDAAAAYGGSALIPSIKGMALPSYDPRGASAMALAYATSDRGACHRRARPVEAQALAGTEWSVGDRVDAVIAEQDRRALRWSLVADDFVAEALSPDRIEEWLAAVGRNPIALDRIGARIWTLVRLFNVREGFSRDDDTLPQRLTEPIDGGPNDGAAIDPASFEAMLDRYYERRGWDDRGRPTTATLERLGLDEFDEFDRSDQAGETR
ncbi:aldehyde ferredoxin oxidoreductase family protein [Natrialba asiatica]|uniref:Aldehyde ferredoxin oxidoreductase n=1 Tax=Natrialba asiatica (strain ATCC 700177 / DSM 12278 / JCM 9576 / FERM P-10747 / NBRC 102637 / 172P1) TaxID=29540 RepID=M0AQ65_NATA1|nr:aldehyde ferredoxin oxidoreductase C-terminal domain-containing protein [Natrialba asiatica]ELY99498.1 aldehyde ferredoxin oxidoreductase [Natrialba asiatica DSM 12278]